METAKLLITEYLKTFALNCKIVFTDELSRIILVANQDEILESYAYSWVRLFMRSSIIFLSKMHFVGTKAFHLKC